MVCAPMNVVEFALFGDISDDRGWYVSTVRSKTGNIELRQPFLIEHYIKAVWLDSLMNIKKTPSAKPLLHHNKEGDPRKHTWRYR